MKTAKSLLVTGTLIAGSAAGGYVLHAYAEGAPTTKPLFYAGTLETNGKPASGTHTIVLTLFDAESGGKAVCTSETPSAPVEDGRFRVEVSPECVAAVKVQPDVWAVLKFTGPDGVPHELPGRSKIGSVPFSLEAQHAVSASTADGALAGKLVPAGMIAMFAGACPAGWAEYAALAGRFPRGERAGQPLDQGGSDDAVVVAHAHGVGTIAAASNGLHDHPLPCSWTNNSAHWHGGAAGSLSESPSMPVGPCNPTPTSTKAGEHTHALSGSSASAGVPGTGANVPRFQEVVFCVKQ